MATGLCSPTGLSLCCSRSILDGRLTVNEVVKLKTIIYSPVHHDNYNRTFKS